MASKEDEALGIKGFKASKHYEQVRPTYPKEGVELLMTKLGLLGENRDKTTPLTVLELGAGTGKFTRVMAEVLQDANVRIIASDPVKEMCEQFKQMQPDIEIRQFGAENIDLPAQSVDSVVTSNSFHWFDFHQSIDQIHGILKPNGTFAVCWILPSPSLPWVECINGYLTPLFQQNIKIWGGNSFEQIHNNIAATGKFSKFSEILPPEFDQHFKVCPQQIYDYFASYSVITTSSDEKKSEFQEFLEKTVTRHCTMTGEKEVTFTHICPMTCFKKI